MKITHFEGGFLPCCDSYDCNLLLRFDLLKPQINNAMKSLIIILALLTINCNVANDNCSKYNLDKNQVALKGIISNVNDNDAVLYIGEILELSNGNYPIPTSTLRTPIIVLIDSKLKNTIELNLYKERILIIEWNDIWKIEKIF